MEPVLSVSSTLDSTIESIDAGEDLVRRFTREAGFGESDEYFIGLASREILVNAIKHGNRFEPDKKVNVLLNRNGRTLTIEVSDEGQGFQLENVPDPLAPENIERHSGRGLMMALAIMDQFFVERTAAGGTHIRMVKNLPAH